MTYPELLSPVGNFDCLKAAVQNGADSIYLGSSMFSARASATNFNLSQLEQAISYAKLRGVQVHLALNTLVKNDELELAFSIARDAYAMGIDAIIVQDLGLASLLIANFPHLPIHASTQMTVHDLDGVLALQKLGFQRVVLSRELSLTEIENISKNSSIEIEAFVHGALCISYSGQCLFSSMIGGRSGNRGKCAQPCRLPYELVNEKEQILDKGFLISPRDLFSIDKLPILTQLGVQCFKIEGRLKSPEYVATVTRIYRKYLDLALQKEPYIIDLQDKQDLLQVFNRGGFSSGHLEDSPNRNLIFKDKPNHMGLYLGKVSHFNTAKGYIDLTLQDKLSIGDKIAIDDNGISNAYRVSEMMFHNINHPVAYKGEAVIIGRMKGNIKLQQNIYKLESKELSKRAVESFSQSEKRRLSVKAHLCINKNQPITLDISCKNISFTITSQIVPVDAIQAPITKERIIQQLCKTKNTIFDFAPISIELQNNLYFNISEINVLRRQALQQLENKLISGYKRSINNSFIPSSCSLTPQTSPLPSTSLLLNILHKDWDYTQLEKIERVYIPLKYFLDSSYSQLLQTMCKTFSVYIYMPTITRKNYHKQMNYALKEISTNFPLKGFVASHLGQLDYLKPYALELIANFTFNIYNFLTLQKIKDLGFSHFVISPELEENTIKELTRFSGSELLVYGNTPVVTSNYCVLGKTNHCYSDCTKLCHSSNTFYLRDRLGLKFRILPDPIDTVSTLYNSKVFSISYSNFRPNSIRIDCLDETFEEINKLIEIYSSGKRLVGKDYTNGNLHRVL